MKLLFDENLSPRLTGALADVYPGSVHVHQCGLGSTDDTAIWQYAKDNGFTIVSKDSDFQEPTFALALTTKSQPYPTTKLILAHELGANWNVTILGKADGPVPVVWGEQTRGVQGCLSTQNSCCEASYRVH